MKTRFLKSVIDTSKSTKLELPFQRGARRTAAIAKRKAQPLQRLKTA